MSPANKHRNGDQLFDILALSGAYSELLDYWKSIADEEYATLQKLAVAALKNRELTASAQVQLGRWNMAREFYEFAAKHKK